MTRFLLLPLSALFIFVVATVAAFVYLPWWLAPFVSLAVFLALIGLGRLTVQLMFRKLQRMSMEMIDRIGVVLRDAEVVVHSVEPATLPALQRFQSIDDLDDPDADSPDLSLPVARYRLDLTIIPKRLLGPDDSWDARIFQVVPFDAAAGDPLNPLMIEHCVPQELELERDGQFERVDPQAMNKSHGRQRLRAVFAVPQGWTVLKLRYFNVDFGRVELPPVVRG